MTRERKELMKKLESLERQKMAEYEMGCGFFLNEIDEAFRPEYEAIYDALAATYGLTRKEHDDYVFNKQCEAYDAGKIQWSPCYGMSI